jgi:hypothetical protein
MSKITLVAGTMLVISLAGGVILDRSVLTMRSVPTTAIAVVGGDMPLTTSSDTLVPSGPLDANQLRAIVREELAFAAARAAKDDHRASVANSAPVVTASPAEQHEAVNRAEAIIASGQWGNTERSEFRQQLGLMSPEERERVTLQWAQGIDGGTIKVSTTGPML